jgi:hypothetical protein
MLAAPGRISTLGQSISPAAGLADATEPAGSLPLENRLLMRLTSVGDVVADADEVEAEFVDEHAAAVRTAQSNPALAPRMRHRRSAFANVI